MQSPGGIRRQLPEAMAWSLGLARMGLADAADWTQAEIGEPWHPPICCAAGVRLTAGCCCPPGAPLGFASRSRSAIDASEKLSNRT